MPPRKKAKLTKPPTRTPSPPATHPDGTPAPPGEHLASHSLPTAIAPSPSPEPAASPQVKPDKWANLKGLMDSLAEASGITGQGAVKSVIEGLVELTGLYEDAARGQEGFDGLRLQLECIFDELKHHLSSSPAITTSMDSICWSVRKEMDIVKTKQARGKKRKPDGAETNTQIVLECFRRIESHLQRLTRNANTSTWQIVDQIATENYLQKLAPCLWPRYNSEKALELERRRCTEGTRAKVLKRIYRWATALKKRNVYWMSGMAGTGKTTIAYTLCEWLDTESNRILGASFFCSRSLPECRDVGRIIPSIAYQLARYSRPFKCALSRAIEKDPDAHTRMPQFQFESLIVQPLSDVEVQEAFPSSVVVVIDALDECEDKKSTKLILDVLLTRAKNLPLRFVVSSRPEPAIRDQMEKNGTWVDARVVLHELDTGEVQTDIATYLKVELNPIAPTDTEIEQLVAHAGVLFIYAATVIRYVGYDDFGRNPRARLKAVLSKTGKQVKAQTNEIDELYGIVLAGAFEDSSLSEDEQRDMKLILGTAICAREPLTATAMNGLLQLDDVDRVHAALRPLWSVLHVMGPSMLVAPLHASFPDYLLDPERSGSWYCDAAAYHHLLALRCFERIRDTQPQFNICRLESSYLIDDEVPDLDARVQEFIPNELYYACQYWSTHLDAADPSTPPSLAPVLLQFLTTHLLLWMEVMNLKKAMSTTLGELTTAKRWATQYGMSCDAIDLLTDACRFTLTFISNPVSQSTPHLYVSMLPLLLPRSPIRRHYYTRFQGMAGAEGTALDRRTDVQLAQWNFDLHIFCMTCSPDGSLVAIGGDTDMVRGECSRLFVLDAFSGNILLDMSEDHVDSVMSIAFSPDSTCLVSGEHSGHISVWDVTNGQPVVDRFKAHYNYVTVVLFSHNAAYMVSASHDKTIRIWNATSGQPALSPLIGHTGEVTCIAVTSDDTRLVSGSEDCTIRVWDMQSGDLVLGPLTGHEKAINVIALSSDDSFIVSGSNDGTVRVWNSKTGHVESNFLCDQSRWVTSISISPDNAAIALTADMYDRVCILDAASGKIISQLGPFSDDTQLIKQAIYLPDGTRIICSFRDGDIRVLDAQSTAAAFDPLPGYSLEITSIDISPDGRHAVSASDDHSLFVWDLSQGTLKHGPLYGPEFLVGMLRFSSDGSRIVSCRGNAEYCAYGKAICQWDIQSGTAHSTPIRVESSWVVSATYSPDGTAIASLTAKGILHVWNSSTSELILGPIDASGKSKGMHAEYSPGGATVIIGYQDGAISAWNVQNGQMVYRYHGQSESSKPVAFSRDGLYSARGFGDGSITLRNTHTGAQLPGAFKGHTHYIHSLHFSMDGNRLVSGSADQTVHVWDVKTGRSLIGPLSGHTDVVKDASFSPDGRHIISISFDPDFAARVWDVRPQTQLSEDEDLNHTNWVLDKDGWVVYRESCRLFWVPDDLRAFLMSPRNTSLLAHR